MFLVMGITGNVGGATARHLLAQGKKVRALVRDREKAVNWENQGVELVDGDWNDSGSIEQALKGVEGTFVMLPPVWAPSPDYKEAKRVIANYVEALSRVAPPRVVALSSMGGEQKHRARGDHGFVAVRARLSRTPIPRHVCTCRRILRKLSFRFTSRSGRKVIGLLQSDKPKINHGRNERHWCRVRNPFDRPGVVRAAHRRDWLDGQCG
ncbi:Putative NADH-flavin reductase [Serratia odorifera]|uniref:NADH-flavin reductase n=1 Tax=Serratia odorifera TaxID=618 RepID=A0A3S4EY99_SEROD|nr:Putative NADH-flavin reductase [Serratia odorifera]